MNSGATNPNVPRTHSALAMSRHADGSLGLERELVPLDASMELDSFAPRVAVFFPAEDQQALIVGIRVFNPPREIQIQRIGVDHYPLVVSRFDAAVYNLGDELPPLEPSDQPYLGELLRFCKVDWPVISRLHPLEITAAPFGCPAACPNLDAVLIVRLQSPTPPYR